VSDRVSESLRALHLHFILFYLLWMKGETSSSDQEEGGKEETLTWE
jgi:hypothetical protein